MSHPFSPYQAVAIDLDGTLLGPELDISPANRAAIDELSSHGLEIILASGRHHTSMLRHARKIPQVSYMVSAQGGYVADIENSNTIFSCHMDNAEALAAISLGLEHDLSIVVYSSQGIHTLSTGPWVDYYSKLTGFPPEYVSIEAVSQMDVLKVAFFEEAERLDEIERLPAFRDTHLYTVRSLTNIFEKAHPNTSKRTGLEALLRHLDIAPERLASFGDANNDTPMFEFSGFSVAMDHAWPAAKKAATIVAPEGDPRESFARAVQAFKDQASSLQHD